jgi:hypothetical protein
VRENGITELRNGCENNDEIEDEKIVFVEHMFDEFSVILNDFRGDDNF